MNIQPTSISVRKQYELWELLAKLSSDDGKLDLLILLESFKGVATLRDPKFIQKINKELLRRGLNMIKFNICNPAIVSLLDCFIGTEADICSFLIPSSSDKFDKQICSTFFRKFRMIETKIVHFYITLSCLTKSFLHRFAKEIQNISDEKLEVLHLTTNDFKILSRSGLASHDIMHQISKFNKLFFAMNTIILPKQLGYKLICINTQSVGVEISAVNLKLAYGLICKNTSDKIIISLTDVDTVTVFLPLFVFKSKTRHIRIKRPNEHLTRTALKAILRYSQFFNYTNCKRIDVGSLPLNVKELSYLKKNDKFIAYNYTPV